MHRYTKADAAAWEPFRTTQRLWYPANESNSVLCRKRTRTPAEFRYPARQSVIEHDHVLIRS